jgi:hypothetical protein
MERIEEDLFSCITKTCRPSTSYHEDETVRFPYASVVCDPETDRATIVTCEHAPHSKIELTSYEWGETVELVLSSWPRSVLREGEGRCVDNFTINDILRSDGQSKIRMRWSSLMADTHPFSLARRLFDCENDDDSADRTRGNKATFVWDYINGDIVRLVDNVRMNWKNQKIFLDPSYPCHAEELQHLYSDESLSWYGYTDTIFVGSPVPFLVGVALHPPSEWSWPRAMISSSGGVYYRGSRVTIDWEERTMTVSAYESERPPAGFAEKTALLDSSDDGSLSLIGWKEGFPRDEDRKKRTWYSIPTGKMSPLNTFHDSSEVESVSYPISDIVDSANQLVEQGDVFETAVAWHKIFDEIDVRDNQNARLFAVSREG